MVNFYSQYGEDQIIFNYISKQYTGNVLDIGANDGKTLSNSLCFIENGWGASLIEASPICFKRLQRFHAGNDKVQTLNYCLSNENKNVVFYHNTTHYQKDDVDLLSTISKESFLGSKRSGNPFETFEIQSHRFDSIEDKLLYNKYEIISIDIEGYDLEILKQIDLKKFDCKVLVIEYNDVQTTKNLIMDYCSLYNMKNVLHDNRTNLILTV